ncbi:hypothetical protein TYRP_014074 [Tyrophagus putrescentiae]|nr:hypothetical protein TYRP_014074 [Tyrophagus putrescentiae]
MPSAEGGKMGASSPLWTDTLMMTLTGGVGSGAHWENDAPLLRSAKCCSVCAHCRSGRPLSSAVAGQLQKKA